MPKLGNASAARLATCHPDIQKVIHRAIELMPLGSVPDFTVTCGYRSDEEQAKAFADGTSLLGPGDSTHQALPSRGIDIAPYIPGQGIPWDDLALFRELAHAILAVAADRGIRLRWGGDWKTLPDPGHLELIDVDD